MANRMKTTAAHPARPSAARRRPVRTGLVWFLSWLLATQPLLVQAADIAADAAAAAANRPRIDAAANGIAVVDIVAPNGAGLSHNKYLRFGVDAAGAVLNNSTATVSLSQLGGLLQGNANLADSGSARVILNEVTSAERSQLAGALEVHGAAADVIVANPNGITCDGCRFINTPRATLSSGTPEPGAAGALAALRVEGGDILIGAGGAAMGATEVFDLVARTISVEGPVNAGGALNLVAGRNLYDYETGLTTALAADGNAPDIAIDSTLLGGMYAGRIAIVSNDLGAGVRMDGQMSATADGMILTADGDLVLRDATAAGTVDARSIAGGIEIADTLLGGSGVALAAAGDFANTGNIGSGATLAIALGGDLTNVGSIGSAGAMTLAGDAGGWMNRLVNRGAGVINGGAGLTVRATDLTNNGAMGSASGALDVELPGFLLNRGLLYAGTSAHFRLDGAFANKNADILAQTDLTVEGLSGERAGAFRNSSGTIEAVAGDLTLKADSVTNKKRAFAVGQTVTTEVTKSENWGQYRKRGTKTTVTVTTQYVKRDSPAARLLAGDDMTIETGTLTNKYSQIAANGDLAITANTATNVGRDLIETTDTETKKVRWVKRCKWHGGSCRHKKKTSTTYDTATRTLSSVYGTIEAGGTLTAAVSGYLHNDAVRDGQVGLLSGTPPDEPVLAVGALAVGALDAALEGLAGRTALFETRLSESAPYLLETRPEFIDPSLYLGSDYFLERIGLVEPDVTMKRFGDAHVETRLVQEQVFAQTGRRYLAGAADARVQMQRLYDSAVDAQRSLGLTVGIALNPGQIAALTDDIVWLEYRTVQGQQVLVPRLYLASATAAGIDLASARIHGGRTAIAAATLVNSGRLAGVDGLEVVTTDALVNRGGALASGGDVEIAAGGLFANLSGTVSGNGVRIAADDIVHATAMLRDRYRNGFADREQQIARIEARGDLRLDAGHSIAVTGAGIETGGDAVLGTGGDIAIDALAVERRFEDVYSRGYSRSESIDHILSRLRAGGALSVEAGGDLALRGAGLSAGGDAALTAGGAVTVASVQDSYNEDFKLSTGGGLFGGSSKIRDQKAGVETRRTTVTAGGALTVRAGAGDLVLDAVSLESGGETALEAEQGKVALLTETDSTFERDYVRREGLVRWKEKDKGHYKEEIEHVEVEAGGGLRIVAGEGVVVEYRKTDSLGASLDRLAQSPGLAWVEQLRGDPGVDWVAVEAAFEEWDYEASGLTQAGAALVTLAAVAVSAGTLSTVSASLAGSLGVGSAAAQAALTAGLTSLTSQAAVALVNHGGDLGAVLKQLGSSAALKSLATAMIAAGLTVELTGFAGLDKALPEKAVLADRVAHSLQQNLIRSTVRTAVSTAIQGGKLDDALVAGWTGAMISSALSGIQHEIGDFGVEHGLPEGSIQKILAHAMAGGLASELSGGAFADGALAGALAEITGPLLGGTGLDEETQVALQRLIGTTAVLLRGSEAGEAMFAGDIAASAHRNNYLSHEEIAEAKELQEKLRSCHNALPLGGCSARELAPLHWRLAALETISEANTLRMIDACKAGQASCETMLAEAGAFNEQLPGFSAPMFPGGYSPTPGMEQFYVPVGDVSGTDTAINLDALAVHYYNRAVAGEITYEEATEGIRTAILEFDSTKNVIAGGLQVAGGVAAAVLTCTATAGLACAGFAGLGAANAILGANTVSGGIDRMLSGEKGRTLIEKGLIEAGYSETEAADFLANTESLVAIADLAAGGLIFKGPLGTVRVGANKPLPTAKPGSILETGSYPNLARPTDTTPANTILGDLDEFGRPTGVVSTITPNSLGTGSPASPTIKPPGFEGAGSNYARGHLLARMLGGAGDDARNLITLFQRNANHPNMSSFERQVQTVVRNGETVNFRVIPTYSGNNPMPTGVTLTARGSNSFNLDVSIPNVNGLR